MVPLKELKVAPYYGCLLTTPDGHLQPGVSHHPGEADHDPAGGALSISGSRPSAAAAPYSCPGKRLRMTSPSGFWQRPRRPERRSS
ncbi:MAG: hypothetical protein MZV70_74570 [Desulfobacterales bacterium]|nr:hypothetical protein [Desulfobacterales bacterium]